MSASPKPAILVISSRVVRGSVGGRGAEFALERLGFPIWSVQTVTLPWHPGHGRAGRIVPDEAAFSTLMDDLARAPWLEEIGGILTGYVGAPSQGAAIARLIDAVRARRPDVLYLCDPVMGDHGTLYVPEATAAAIRDHLAPRADVLTPNLTELAFLAGTPLDSPEAILAAARGLSARRVAITSATTQESETETLLVTPGSVLTARHPLVQDRVPKGTGDLFAGLLLGRLLAGLDDAEALRLTTASIVDALQAAQAAGTDELPLAAIQHRLVEPAAAVTVT